MDAKSVDSDSDQEPLLLLPGLICDSRIFDGQFGIVPGAVTAADYRDAATLAEMAAVVLASAPARFAVLGHSMGARVAIEVFRQAPERVTRLGLASTGIHLPGAGEAEGRHRLRDLGRARGYAALVDTWLPPMIGPAQGADAALHARLRAMSIDAGQARFERQIEALLARPAVEDVLASVSIPTLIAVGSDDRWAPPEQHVAIAAIVPRARLIVIEGAGHMLPAERPTEFNAAIAAWRAIPINEATIEGETR